ncbi:MAG: glutamine--tRNA ligase/YqeY domain fusion protein [Gemmatimonas sp.]|nr:glutamine--tRNA ligase/YqeY domain fusion protein [Gemmatimonas sp.]
MKTPAENGPTPGLDFIRTIVAEDLEAGLHGGRVVTRFPPEPNGYLHIGHATAVCLNFNVALENGGVCHLRFDDTNPETEDIRYVRSITEDVRWLGFDWGEHLYYASDCFEQMYGFAEHLIREGKAYVESASEDEIRDARGSVTEPGSPTPSRSRSVEENLDLFRRMRAGEFPDGTHVLRAKIDLASPNMLLRDPVLYRIRHAHHYRTGDEWCIYPLYDWAHPIEDAIECVTHSICTLEFETHRPLYNWVVENIPVGCRPHQYEFARRNLEHTVMSKRKLLELVEGGYVDSWDDPRMPTVAGLRRRGVTPEAIRTFADLAGVGKTENRIDIGKLEFAIRDDLNQRVPRVLCVLRPLKVVITNFPEGEVEHLEAPYYPRDVPREGSRVVPFTRTIYIEREDFQEDPPSGYHRLAPGNEVRLRYAYVIRCDEVIRDERGGIAELRCTYDRATRGGKTEGRTVKGTIHWVSADHSVECEVRLYDRLFLVPDPEEAGEAWKETLNPESLVVIHGARIEPSVREDPPNTRYQFERLGYFWRDPIDSESEAMVFNRTVMLRDTWVKQGEAAEELPTKPKAEVRVERHAETSTSAPEPERSAALEARRERYVRELGVGDAEGEIITREDATAELFETAIATGATPRTLANWIVHEVPREAGERALSELPFGGQELGRLVVLLEDGTLSSSAGRDVLAEMTTRGGAPDEIVERRGLHQISDPEKLGLLVDEVIAQNAKKAAEYRDGRTGLLGFFVGQVMRKTGGRANPEVASKLLESRLR